MRESDIMHESPCGRYWVARRVSRNASIAPIGSVYYQISKTGTTHSVLVNWVSANLDRAITTCDRLARAN